MYLQKRKFKLCAISLLFIFLFASMKSSICILSFSSTSEMRYEEEEEQLIVKNDSCSLEDGSCCCPPASHNRQDCCCKSPTLGKSSGIVGSKTTDNNFLNAFFSNVGCCDNSGDYNNTLISDYEPLNLITFSYVLEEIGSPKYLQDNHIDDPHLLVPYKPPKSLS